MPDVMYDYQPVADKEHRCDRYMDAVDANDRPRAKCCACGGGQCQSVSAEDLELLHPASMYRVLEATVPGPYPASGTYYVEIPTRNLIPKESWRSVLRVYTGTDGVSPVDYNMDYQECKQECDWTAYCGPPPAKCEEFNRERTHCISFSQCKFQGSGSHFCILGAVSFDRVVGRPDATEDNPPNFPEDYESISTLDGQTVSCVTYVIDTHAKGCDGVVGSGTTVDICGVCGGSGFAAGTCNCAGDTNDACGVCAGDGTTCAGCDGVSNSGKTNDECGVCDGDGSTCAGCDGVPNSGKTNDACGVCDGDGSTYSSKKRNPLRLRPA